MRQDVVELVEDSLDLNIIDGFLRLRFNGATVIGPVTVRELNGHVVLLVATSVSVHRLLFPHPSQLQKVVGLEHYICKKDNYCMIEIF